MNNTIQFFANPEFGEIRTIKQADEIYLKHRVYGGVVHVGV